jgi:UDP-glucuronate decarboxylase
MNYHDQNKVRIKIARIFNTYGPKMSSNDGRVVSNFILQALKGENITIFGDGSHTRSFQYIDDLINGLIRLMDTPDYFTGPVNLGNPGEVAIRTLAEMIIKMTGSRSKIIYLPLPQDDPKQRKPDITLAEKELGWSPKVDSETGLAKTVEYFRKTLGVK